MRVQRPMPRPAFTRSDLVVLVSVVALLLSFLLPALLSAQGAGGRRQTMNNLKQIGLALHNFNDTYRRLPPAYGKVGQFSDATVHVYLMPFIEEDNHFKQYMETKGADKAQMFKIPVFLSEQDPSRKDKHDGVQNFAANLRVFSDIGVKTAYNKDLEAGKKENFDGNARIPATFIDGTSNTIVYATKYGVCGEGGSRYAPNPHNKFAAFFGANAANERRAATAPRRHSNSPQAPSNACAAR